MLEFGGQVIEDTPKSETSVRSVPLDGETVRVLHEHRKAQPAERLAAGSAYGPGDWVIANEFGCPYRPDLIPARFRQAARAAGLPVIKLHEATTRPCAAPVWRPASMSRWSVPRLATRRRRSHPAFTSTCGRSRPPTLPSGWPHCSRGRLRGERHSCAACSPDVPRAVIAALSQLSPDTAPPQVSCGEAAGARTQDRRIMSPVRQQPVPYGLTWADTV